MFYTYFYFFFNGNSVWITFQWAEKKCIHVEINVSEEIYQIEICKQFHKLNHFLWTLSHLELFTLPLSQSLSISQSSPINIVCLFLASLQSTIVHTMFLLVFGSGAQSDRMTCARVQTRCEILGEWGFSNEKNAYALSNEKDLSSCGRSNVLW